MEIDISWHGERDKDRGNYTKPKKRKKNSISKCRYFGINSFFRISQIKKVYTTKTKLYKYKQTDGDSTSFPFSNEVF